MGSLIFAAALAAGLYLATVSASVILRGADNGNGPVVANRRATIAAIITPLYWALFITFGIM